MDARAFLASVVPLVRRVGGPSLAFRALRRLGIVRDDLCPDVRGMASPKKMALLNRAVAALPPAECYLEVGTFQGKSLISALLGNPGATAVACDNFSLFDDPVSPQNRRQLEANLTRHGVAKQVRFFDCDFRQLLGDWRSHGLPPVGIYFYDGAHDEESQYLGIKLAEPVLADSAVVFVDDWRHAADSESFAEVGTKRAIGESRHHWAIAHVLPARWNGDREQWWNGLGVLTFSRRPSSR